MRVLNVCLYQPKPILMPALDQRVLGMVGSRNFFSEVSNLASDVQKIAEEKFEEEPEYVTRLG